MYVNSCASKGSKRSCVRNCVLSCIDSIVLPNIHKRGLETVNYNTNKNHNIKNLLNRWCFNMIRQNYSNEFEVFRKFWNVIKLN